MRRVRPLSGVLLLATLVAVAGGCGLPDPPPVLPRPTNPSASDTADTFRFSQPAGTRTDRVRSVATFGYEIYYRFSAVGEATDRNLEELSQLRAKGFVRLAGADESDPIGVTDRPLIEVPSAARSSHRVTLSFAAITSRGDPQATLVAGGNDVRISLRRGVGRHGIFERFVCDRFQEDHADVAAFPRLAEECDRERVQLQLYVVAYGRDAERREQFSDALYLGSINLTFP